MGKKRIGQLENGLLTSPNDKLIFENTRGETKSVTYGSITGSSIDVISQSDRVLLQNGVSGLIGYLTYAALIGYIFGSTVRPGSGIRIAMASDASGLHPEISSFVNVSALFTLTADDWSENTGYFEQSIWTDLDENKRYIVDNTLSETPLWKQHGVYVHSILADNNRIVFRCETKPEASLSFKLVSMNAVYL